MRLFEATGEIKKNNLSRLRNAMYESCNHIDGNEKLQSNTSGTALRNRLIRLAFMLALNILQPLRIL